MPKLNSLADLAKLRERVQAGRKRAKPCITVCAGTGCTAAGSREVLTGLRREIREQKLGGKLEVKSTGCQGFCERGPVMLVWPEKIFYNRVKVGDVKEIIASSTDGRQPIARLLYVDPVSGERVVHEDEVPFYKRQRRILFANNGKIDPNAIQDYLAVGGYTALARVLSGMRPEEVIDEVARSGLRGRGGAGFPTGKKWQVCRANLSTPKFIICNADEGDPGAFMDRSLLEGNPHSVIEGMIIGAYAIGASQGYVYVRTEYPLALKHLSRAIAQAEAYGLLGENILGSGLDFRIQVVQGAGAFVCGEETAMIASIEGGAGEPRPRPPYPAQRGLWGKPTVINNVKTWASVPVIITRGADWYASIGTAGSKGTMVFSLVGKINNTGLVEVPMGITLRELIYEIGGGIPGGKKFKAVQTGGPSGGCIPASLIDLPVDYEELTAAGSMMGSGGMVVMDENTCMVDIAKYFLTFLEDESCGKCFPCRVGLQRLREIVERIAKGKGTEEDLTLLEELSWLVKEASLCGLGQTAPNPVLSTLRYFRDEYLTHIREKKCPAKVCRELITYAIDPVNCNGCGACVQVCLGNAITGEKKKLHTIDQSKCTKCGACLEICKFDAVLVS